MVEVGGGLRLYRAGGDDILDGYAEDDQCAGGRGQLLSPWPNRLAGGRFAFGGVSYQAPLSEADKGNAIHGLVRWANWSPPPGAAPEGGVSLSYRLHPQPGWGWTLDLRVDHRLDAERGLEVRTSVTNVSDRPCPIGIGWHPYVRTDVDRTRLTVPAGTVYDSDDRGLPTGRRPVEGTDLDFRAGRVIGRARLDRCFTGLERDADGRVVVTVERHDGRVIRWWADRAFSHVMVFTGDTLADESRRRHGLAVEPMTCAPDMLNSGDGMHILEPGSTFDATWGIDPFSPAG